MATKTVQEALDSITAVIGQNFARKADLYVRGLGSTDDKPVIDAAFAAAGARSLVIPTGATVNLPSTLTIPAGKRLIVEAGAKLVRTGAGTGLPVVLSAGSVLEGMGTIDAAGKSEYAVALSGDGARLSGVTVKGYTVYGVAGYNTGVVVDGCTILGGSSYGIILEAAAVEDIRITNNKIVSGQGIHAKNGVHNSIISGNVLDVSGVVGIEAVDGTDTLTITGNNVRGAQIGISLSNSHGNTVAGNVVSECQGIGIENSQGASDNTIVGNSVTKVTGVAITVTSPDMTTRPLRNVVVSGNTIEGGQYGVNIERGRNIVVSDNALRDCTSRPIFLNNGPVHCRVSGNTIRSSASIDAAIYADGEANVFDGNLVDLSGGNGIYLKGARHTATHNNFWGVGCGVAVDAAPGVLVEGNRTHGGASVGHVNFFGAAASTGYIGRCFCSTGEVVENSAGATLGGPVVTIA